MKRTIGVLILLVVCISPLSALAAPPASGALLTAGQGAGNPGSTGVVVPITLETAVGEGVAALNFDLQYDESKLSVADVTLGAAAQAAGKIVASSLPLSGTVRVIVYGENQNVIGDGVIANIVFDISASATAETLPLNFSDAVAASPEATAVALQTAAGSVVITGEPTTFADVPRSHWAYGYIEALYQAGYITGCQVTPQRLFCPDANLTRGEMGVFIERGHHGASFTPVEPATPDFTDTPTGVWSTKWAQAMYDDGYTAGCGTNPLIFCPNDGHLRNQMTVYFERMLHGKDYVPAEATVQHYLDVPIGAQAEWDSKWIYGAYADQLIQDCEDEANRGDQYFRRFEEATRAEVACVMTKAKNLTPILP